MSTIKMVADRAGVSTATVSRALSNPEVVLPETRAAIHAAIDALGYAPNFAAKSLRTLRTSKIIVMVPDISNPFFSEVLRGAEDAAQSVGYSVLLGDTRDDLKRESQYAGMLQRKEADGVIFLGHRIAPALAKLVVDKGPLAPVVNGCDFSPDHHVASVHIDNVKAAEEAMNLLFSMGHRRIAIISGPLESHITRDRIRGVKQSAAGCAGSDVAISHAHYSIEAGEAEMRAILARKITPTAVFCFSDELAIGALAACRSRDVECPRDVSIIGFDDIRYARFADPPLTTIRQPKSLIGETAVQLLLAILRGKVDRCERITLKHEVVVRASTGPAKSQSPRRSAR